MMHSVPPLRIYLFVESRFSVLFPSIPILPDNTHSHFSHSHLSSRIDHPHKHADRRQATPQITRGDGLPQGHLPEPDQNGPLPLTPSFALGCFWRHPSHSILRSVGCRKEDAHHGSVARDVWKWGGEGGLRSFSSLVAACGEARVQSAFR